MVSFTSPRWLLVFAVLIFICLALGTFFLLNRSSGSIISPLGSLQPTPTPTPKPLLQYSFTNLKNTPGVPSQIALTSILDEQPEYASYLFTYQTQGKTMSGQLNVPTTATPSAGFPVILMLRGYVDPSIYQTGVGTMNAAAVFAKNGYITLAPDFLGYGSSDPPAANPITERLEKPRHLLDLLASTASLKVTDPGRLGIWAHSNGGQIAISLLEITGRSIPTTLWAPVTKPFPYSILYYTDESDDQGKALRKEIANFETSYDVFDYSIDRYYDWLNAPLQLHQGSADDAVPLDWSTEFVDTLEELDKDITYFTYPGSDHNLRPAWDTAIARDLEFFAEHFKQ